MGEGVEAGDKLLREGGKIFRPKLNGRNVISSIKTKESFTNMFVQMDDKRDKKDGMTRERHRTGLQTPRRSRPREMAVESPSCCLVFTWVHWESTDGRPKAAKDKQILGQGKTKVEILQRRGNKTKALHGQYVRELNYKVKPTEADWYKTGRFADRSTVT